MFGHNNFDYTSPPLFIQSKQIAFSAENETIPPLKEIYEKGHPFVKEFTIGESATGISWPDAKTLQIIGHDGTFYTGSDYDPSTGEQVAHYGTLVRIIPADGYKVVVGGWESDGYGKVLPSHNLPFKKEIHIIGPDGTKYTPTKTIVTTTTPTTTTTTPTTTTTTTTTTPTTTTPTTTPTTTVTTTPPTTTNEDEDEDEEETTTAVGDEEGGGMSIWWTIGVIGALGIVVLGFGK